MTLFLKFFWMTVLTVIVGGLIIMSIMGIPSPSVTVQKELPVESPIK